MNHLVKISGTDLTMSSREIAALVESRHDDVKRSVERLAERGVITLPPLAEVSNVGPGPKFIKEYRLCKRDSLIVVAQLCPEFTARIVDRWQELEEQAAKSQFAIPQTLSEALRLAADLNDQKRIAEEKLAIAAPKASALDRIATLADGSMCVTAAAKYLQVAPKKLFDWLRANNWAYKRAGGKWLAYQPKLAQGVLDHKVTTVLREDGSEKMVEQLVVTAKGLAKLAEVFSQMNLGLEKAA